MDIELYCQEKGNGEPFLFLHGNGGNSAYFKNQIEYFQSKYRVIALDTRGHGKSPRGDAPFTIAQFSCDLYDFMQAHQILSAVILGFSDGANIAMKFATEHPDMVKALILSGGNLDPTGVKRVVQIPIEIGYKIARRFAAKSTEAKKNAEMLGLMVNEPNIKPNALSRISIPTLVICGTKDMIKESHTKEIAESLPNAKMVILRGNHFLANQRPAEFNLAVDDFLKTL
ncbi:alpha/beta fold hydrolase [Yeguia hominis]|uniref:Alpha/beta hydrolase n=1 Tax=Yeguia hominis TaxID=2763662 RepID=A0A926DC36_9FIRM|nr:alpha/beta hydrolase [Yeguia hominis]MBC8534255.1 alpha/beta hydrolase [Yeguia hominis]